MIVWREFWHRILSPQTARFVLALLALGFAAYGADKLIDLADKEAGQASVFAVGQLFALATMAFGYYFGSTARADERTQVVQIEQPADDPVPTQEQGK
jgi:hypothetical protein